MHLTRIPKVVFENIVALLPFLFTGVVIAVGLAYLDEGMQKQYNSLSSFITNGGVAFSDLIGWTLLITISCLLIFNLQQKCLQNATGYRILIAIALSPVCLALTFVLIGTMLILFK